MTASQLDDVARRRRNIGLKVHVVSRLLRRKFDRMAAKIGATRSQWQMIVAVSGNPGLTQRCVADALEISEAAAGRLIDKLAAEGLLERRECDGDRRARAVYLTARAEEVRAAISELARTGEDVLFKDFSEAELVLFEDFIDRLHRNAMRFEG